MSAIAEMPEETSITAGVEDDGLGPQAINVALDAMCDRAVRRWANPLGFAFQAIAGGAMVMFGVMLAVAVSAGIAQPGLANLVSGTVFGFSFVVIMVSGASLITSDMAAGAIALARGRMSPVGYIAYIALGWAGNVAGALIFIAIIAAGPGQYVAAPFLARAHVIGVAKAGAPDLSVFCMGIICTWLLQTAFLLFAKARTDVGKMIMAWYGPLAFVAGMTQHCIANIGFIGLPLLMQGKFKAALATHASAHAKLPMLTWGFGRLGLFHNQVFAFLGNWVGGTVFVALLFMAIVRFSPRMHGQRRLAPRYAVGVAPRVVGDMIADKE
jgi:formate/nitrite transporter FocA (FNT family)